MRRLGSKETSCRVATGSILPEECVGEAAGLRCVWDLCESEHGWSSLLRNIYLNVYKNYLDLLKAMENMFKGTIGVYSERDGYNVSEFAPTYEDKDWDWMLVGDVPWDMFIVSCKRLWIMKRLSGASLLIFANKQDIQGSLSPDEIAKILGDGELNVKLKFKARAFSKSAKVKLEALGCSLTVLPSWKKWVKPSVDKNIVMIGRAFLLASTDDHSVDPHSVLFQPVEVLPDKEVQHYQTPHSTMYYCQGISASIIRQIQRELFMTYANKVVGIFVYK